MTYPKLPKGLKKRWVAALRSGKYKQGKGTLLAGGKYCCLGVLCEIVNGIVPHNSFIPENMPKIPAFLRDTKLVPKRLSVLNDGTDVCRAKGFKAIATWIDKHL